MHTSEPSYVGFKIVVCILPLQSFKRQEQPMRGLFNCSKRLPLDRLGLLFFALIGHVNAITQHSHKFVSGFLRPSSGSEFVP